MANYELMKFRWILYAVLAGLVANHAKAQVPLPFYPQDAYLDHVDFEPYTQYFNNQFMFNPAFAGDDSQPVASVIARHATSSRESGIWQALPPLGAALGQLDLAPRPQLYHFNINSYEPSWKSSWGIHATYFKPGNPNSKRVIDAGLSFNYELPMGDVWKIRLGLSASIIHYDEDFLYNVDGSPYIGGPNQYIPVKLNERKIKTNNDLGILLKGPKLYIGASIANMNEPSFQFYEAPGGRICRFRRKTYVTAGSNLDLGGVIKFKPSIFFSQYLTNSTGRNFSMLFDVNLLAEVKDRYTIGTTVRFNDRRYGGALALGYKFAEKYQLMFSYDLPKSDVSSFTYSRFEAGLYLHLPRVWEEAEDFEDPLEE